MGGLNQKQRALLRSSKVRITEIPQYEEIAEFELRTTKPRVFMNYCLYSYNFLGNLEIKEQSVDIGSINLVDVVGQEIYKDGVIFDIRWEFVTDELSKQNIERKLAEMLSIPSLSDVPFFYYLTLNIGQQLKFSLVENNLKFYTLLEYVRRGNDFMLDKATLYSLGIYEEIEFEDFDRVNLGGVLSRLIKRLDYQLDIEVVGELSVWWLRILKEFFVKFYKALFKASGIKKLERQRVLKQ